jgi:hypothetical protein
MYLNHKFSLKEVEDVESTAEPGTEYKCNVHVRIVIFSHIDI